MRELNVMEVNAVSGAGFGDAVFSATIGALTGLVGGALIGVKVGGGDAGGILGVGAISGLCGLIVGMVLGVTAGGAISFIYGWENSDTVASIVTQVWTNMANGTFPG